jgi:Flp pilus assembly pilin Flp
MSFSFLADTHISTNLSPRNARQRGASMVEYALLVSLIAIVAIIALKELGNSTANQFVKIATDLGGAVE